MRTRASHSTLLWASALALCQFLILFALIGIAPIGGSSEAREAHISQIILRGGEWLLPLRDGLLPSKPPLYHWITSSLGRVFPGGVSPYVARLTSLIFGCGVIFLTACMAAAGCKSSPQLQRARNLVATTAALILATTYGFQNIIADARVDMTCCFFVCLAVFPVLTAFSSGTTATVHGELQKSWRWTLFFGAAGLGVLAKGPLAIVAPGLVCFAMLVVALGFRQAVSTLLTPRFGWVLFFALALPWYVLATQRGGSGFIQRQLFFENLDRFVGGQGVNSEAIWFYFPSFLRTAFPWSLLIFALVPALVRALWTAQVRSNDATVAGSRVVKYLAAVWFWTGFIFLTISSGKRHSYLLPFYPGMAIFLALQAADWVSALGDRGRARALRLMSSVRQTLPLILLLLVAAFDLLRFPIPGAGPLFMEIQSFLARFAFRTELLLLFIVTACFVLELARRLRELQPLGVFVSAVALVAFPIYAALSVKNFTKGFDRAASQIRALNPNVSEVVVIREPRDEFFDPLLYYFNAEVALRAPADVAAVCGAPIVMRRADANEALRRDPTLQFREDLAFNFLDQSYAGKTGEQYFYGSCSRSETDHSGSEPVGKSIS